MASQRAKAEWPTTQQRPAPPSPHGLSGSGAQGGGGKHAERYPGSPRMQRDRTSQRETFHPMRGQHLDDHASVKNAHPRAHLDEETGTD